MEVKKNCVDLMQTREELYECLNYYEYEKLYDDLFGKNNNDKNEQ